MGFLYIPTTDFKQVQLGRVVKIYGFPGGIDDLEEIFNPKHGHSMQGSNPDPAEIQRTFLNGKDSFLVDVTDNALTADDFITANGKKIPFGAGAGKIPIGADEAATRTNISTFLAALPFITAEVESNKVKVTGTGKRAEEPLKITSSTAKVTVTNDTANSGTPATLKLKISGNLFAPKSQNRAIIPLKIGGKPDKLYINTLTPTTATTSAEVCAAIKAVFDKAHAGTAPTDDDGNTLGYIYSERLRSYEEIKAALIAAFGASSATAYTIGGTNSDELTITYGTKGTVGNAQFMLFGIWCGSPEIDIYIDISDQPCIAGIGPGIFFGSTLAYDRKDTPQTAKVPQDSGPSDLGTGFTGNDPTLTFTLNQVHKELHQRLAAGAAQVAADATRNYVIPGAGRLERWCFIAVVDGEIGQKHMDITPNAYVTGGLEKELTRASTKGLVIAASILGGDSIISGGFSILARQIEQV